MEDISLQKYMDFHLSVLLGVGGGAIVAACCWNWRSNIWRCLSFSFFFFSYSNLILKVCISDSLFLHILTWFSKLVFQTFLFLSLAFLFLSLVNRILTSSLRLAILLFYFHKYLLRITWKRREYKASNACNPFDKTTVNPATNTRTKKI